MRTWWQLLGWLDLALWMLIVAFPMGLAPATWWWTIKRENRM